MLSLDVIQEVMIVCLEHVEIWILVLKTQLLVLGLGLETTICSQYDNKVEK